MAQERIEIKFIPTGNVALVKAIKELNKATNKLNGELKRLSATNVNVAKTQDLVTRRVSSNTAAVNANSTAFTRLQSTISVYRNKMLLAGFATALIIRPLIQLTALFGKFEDLERGFINLGSSIDASSEHLNKLRKATNGTVSDMELMQQANNAMMLGVVESEDQMALLFDAAQRMGQALGRDAVSSIESMVSGMGRQSKLMLDNIGIMVDVNKAYENFALENNKAVNSLEDFEKKQAFNNEVIKQSQEALKNLGDEVMTTSQKVQIIDNSATRLGIAFGEALAPAISVLSKMLETLANILDASMIQSIAAVVAGLVAFKAVAFVVAIGLGKIAAGLALGIAIFAPYVAAFAGLVFVLNKYVFAETEAEAAARKRREEEEKLNAAADKNIPKLQKELALLEAKTDLQKRQIELGRPLREDEIELINLINVRKKQIEDQNELERERIQKQKEIQSIIEEAAMFGRDRTLEALKEKQSLIAAEINHAEAIMHRAMMEGENTEESARMGAILDDLKQTYLNIGDEIDRHNGRVKEQTDKNRELTDKEKALKDAIQAGESAYNSTNEAQKKLLRSQIKIIEGLDKTDPANQKAIAGLDALKNKLNELVAESDAIDILGENLTQTLETISGFLDEQVALTQASAEARMKIFDDEANAEIAAKKKSRGFDRLSASQQEKELAKIREDAEKKKKKERDKANKAMAVQFRLNQILAVNETLMNTSRGAMLAIGQTGIFGFSQAAIIKALGAAEIATILAQKPPKMEQGGLIGGRRHSQGGTLIEAEQGEFVMNRNAVDAIGVENLNRMNMGGGAPVSISFSGNVMSDDFIENEAIPKIKEAVRRGSDIGVS